MRISDYEKGTSGGRTRISAKVVWEDSERPEQNLYFETGQAFSADLNINPNAFLLAALIPAMRRGERRVRVEGEVCPQLRNGLITAMKFLALWWGPPAQGDVAIEATQGFRPPRPKSFIRVASFMSGGVDSLATLLTNRMDFPLDHPGAVRDCLFVHGFDVGGYLNWDPNLENFGSASALLTDFCEAMDTRLIAVYTNLRHLEGETAGPMDNRIFTLESHGAALAAVAHAFSEHVTSVLIPPTDCVTDLAPWGSHPLLNPNYASADIQIRHDRTRVTRLDKVRLLSDSDACLKVLRSCLDTQRPGHEINCGKCEKCLRTMVQLLVVGKLRDCPTFPMNDISADRLDSSLYGSPTGKSVSPYNVLSDGRDIFWDQLIAPLQAIGRNDLAVVVKAKLAEFQRWQRRLKLKAALWRFDRRFLRGRLYRLRSHMRH